MRVLPVLALLLIPLLIEFFLLAPSLPRLFPIGGSRVEDDDDMGFLTLPAADWGTRKTWDNLVAVDESSLIEPTEAPVREGGLTLKERIQRLQQAHPQDRDIDSVARLHPPPLSKSVPKIIHQTWKSYEVQHVFKNFTMSWRNVYPDWEYWFWTDADVEELVRVSYPRYSRWYHSFGGYANWIQRADTWKYMALHSFGGVYADLDVEAIRPFDELITRGPLVLSSEPVEHSWILNRQEETVCNAFMASVAAHPFWLYVLEHISQNTGISDPVDSTGPRMLETVLHDYNTRRQAARVQQSELSVERQFPAVKTADPELFMPFFDIPPVRDQCQQDYLANNARVPENTDANLRKKAIARCEMLRDRNYTNVVPDTSFTIHHWSHTWLGAVRDTILFDISPQMSVGPQKDSKLPSFEPEEVWVEKVLALSLVNAKLEQQRQAEDKSENTPR